MNKLDKMSKYMPIFGMIIVSLFCLIFSKYATYVHAIMLLTLSGVYMFQQYLVRQENHDYNKRLEALKVELEAKLLADREFLMKKFERVEDEVSKVALNAVRASSNTSSKRSPLGVNF